MNGENYGVDARRRTINSPLAPHAPAPTTASSSEAQMAAHRGRPKAMGSLRPSRPRRSILSAAQASPPAQASTTTLGSAGQPSQAPPAASS